MTDSPSSQISLAMAASHWLTRRVSQPKNNAAIAGSLLFVIFLWGGNNAGTKWLVAAWPPIWTGGIRFLLAGLLLLAVLRFTSWLGEYRPLTLRIAPAIVVARRFEPGGVYCRLQLGLAPDRRFARGVVSRRVAGVDLVVGGTAATDVGQRAALRSGVAGAGRRAGPVLAGFANGKIGPARRIFGAGREHLVGEFQPSNAHFKRQLERGGSRGAHDVDVGDCADAVRAGGDCSCAACPSTPGVWACWHSASCSAA